MAPNDADMPEVPQILRDALDSPNPLDLLAFASGLASVLDAKKHPLEPSDPEDYGMPESVDEFAQMLIATPSENTDALLVAWAAMLDNPPLKNAIRTEVRPRMKVVPPWFGELPNLHVKRALLVEDVLGGEETLLLEVGASRHAFTIIVAVERLGNPFVEDAFVVPGTADEVQERILSGANSNRALARPVTLKDARALVETALEINDMLYPPVETDTWPDTRPLLEWQLRTMPEGGEGYVYHELTDERRKALLDQFMASPYASQFGSNERQLADLLLDLANNYGSGNPLQWGPRFVGRLLLDLIPRKVMFVEDDMLMIPLVLGAFVDFSNEQLGVSGPVADQVPALITRLLPQYLVSTGVLEDGSDLPDDEFDEAAWGLAEGMPFNPHSFDPIGSLAEIVGSREALDDLTSEPLPVAEPLNLEGVEDDVVAKVEKIGGLVKTYARKYFGDPEMMTAALRTLHLIAAENPEFFRRRAKDLNTAAVILLIAAEDNRWFDRSDPKRTAKALAKVVGISAVDKNRAYVATRELSVPVSYPFGHAGISLGRPELLTSTRRLEILEEKEMFEGRGL